MTNTQHKPKISDGLNSLAHNTADLIKSSYYSRNGGSTDLGMKTGSTPKTQKWSHEFHSNHTAGAHTIDALSGGQHRPTYTNDGPIIPSQKASEPNSAAPKPTGA